MVSCLFFFPKSRSLTLIEYELFSLPYFDLTESKKLLLEKPAEKNWAEVGNIKILIVLTQ